MISIKNLTTQLPSGAVRRKVSGLFLRSKEMLNVLIAQRSLYSSEDALVQSERNIATNLIAIYKALGSGWE